MPVPLSARRRSRRSALISAIAAALALALLPTSALALPPDPARAEVPREEIVLETLDQEKLISGTTRDANLENIAVETPEATTEAPAGTTTPPAADSAPVAFGGLLQQKAGGSHAASAEQADPGPLPAGNLPVKLGRAPGAAMPTGTWQVGVSARTAAESDGVDGPVVTVTAPAGASVPVSVQLDYKNYQNLYGADWASRLRFVQFPECYVSTPDVEGCRTYEELETTNDTDTKTITATVDTAADGTVTPALAPRLPALPGVMRAAYVRPAAATAAAAGGDKAVVGAVDSGAGEGGSFKATPLAESGKWVAGGSSGAFNWSYPLTVPPAPAGPTPDISFEYSSQSVDGRTATTSPQASWVGEGWSYEPGHIERRYRTCQDDRADTAAGVPNNKEKKYKTSDLCWVSYNAVMSLGGKTNELVRVGETNVYKPKNDDGTRVELKTGADNGDNNGEYWIVTTTDGTQFSFGLNKVGGGHADTKSVLTVPVYGNHPGEPCYASTFADSRCVEGSAKKQQAWQWGLDKAVDVHGNALIVNWAQETNHYAPNKKFTSPEQYIRGGYPTSIEYGLHTSSLTSPSARIIFNAKERCLEAGSACDEAKFNNTKDPASYRPWWDAPGNLNCKADSKLCPAFPSFWTRKRLESVTTEAARPGVTGLAKVDTYTLHHSFPRDWYDTSPGLWLTKITRRGFAPGDSTGTLMSDAGVSFGPYVVGTDHPLGSYLKDRQLRNLVPKDSKDPRPGFTRPRVGTVSTEHGADIEVVYRGGCRTQPDVAQDKNTNTCYPTRWSPDGEEEKPALSWFNKYVVDSVTETDKIAGVSDRITTKYTYAGGAWGKSDDEFTKPALRTHSEWRGFQQVITIKGSKSVPSSGYPQTQSYGVTRYFRGAGGEVKDSKDAVTLVADDQEQYAGTVAETMTYDGSGGRVLKRTLTFPWSKQTASRDRDGGVGALLAHRAGIARTDEIQTVGTSWQAVRTTTKVDPDYGLPIEVESSVVKPNGTGESFSDRTCVTTEYVHNVTAHLIGLPKSGRTTATSCAGQATADPATQLTGATRTSYDDLAWGAAPAKGLPTTVAEINGAGTAHSVVTTTSYDPLGRVRKVTKPEVGTTETQYIPSDGGPTTSVKIINPKGHTSVTTLDPGRGTPLTVTDANGRVTRSEYDALGRVIKNWSPSRSTGTQTPDVQVTYQMAVATPTETKPSAVTVRTLKDDGGYAKQVTVYDGLMRPVQTQSEAHGPGRVITDTRYNDHGAVSEQTGAYLTRGEPEPAQFKRASDSTVPSLVRTRYDGLDRPVRISTFHNGVAKFSSVTTYGDTSTYTSAPYGGAAPATNVWTDARGRTTEIQHYTNTQTSQWRSTYYGYDARGNRDRVTDLAGNVWTSTYDARGRQLSTTDPDTGEWTFGYDDADRRTEVTDAKKTTRFTAYDELNRVIDVREGSKTAAPVLEYTYDSLPGALGRPVASVRHDKSGDYIDRVTSYDEEYRPTGTETVIPANTGTTGVAGTYRYAYTYTATTGQPLSTTLPAVGGLAAEKVVTRYNGDGLPESTSGQSWYTSDVTYSPYGEPLRTVSGPQPYRVWTTNFLDEATGRLQRTVTDRETANEHRIADSYYSYDVVGNVTSNARKVTSGATTTWDNQCFTYDAMGQLVHAWTAKAPMSLGTGCSAANGKSWGYQDTGAASTGPIADAAVKMADTSTSAPSATLTASLETAAPAAGTVTSGTTSYWDSYTYDAIGNRAAMAVHDPADPAKVTKLNYGHGTYLPGNGTSPGVTVRPHTMTYRTSTPAGQGASYSYDSNGNTEVRDLPDTTQSLKWTTEDKLESATVDGITTTYVYDANGRRILENSPSGSVLYLGETELTTSGGKITRATRTYAHPGAPTVIRSTDNGSTTGHTLSVLLTDTVGTANTSVEIGANQPVSHRSFKPYGEIRGPKPAWPNRRTYLGTGIDDTNTGLTHIGAREYDQSTGRFISADPVIDFSDPLQMNGYAYANNSPVSASDPSGLYCDSCNWDTPQGNLDGESKPEGSHPLNTTRPPAPKSDLGNGRAPKLPLKLAKEWMSKGYPSSSQIAKTIGPYQSVLNEELGLELYYREQCSLSGSNEFCRKAREFYGGYKHIESIESIDTCPICGNVGFDMIMMSRLGPKGKPGANCGKCFLAGTDVLMADGKTRDIEDIKPGDKVMAKDPETGESGPRVVTRLIVTEDDKYFNTLSIATADGVEKLTATHEHPFWSPSERRWVEARDLRPGATLLTDDDKTVIVTANRPFAKHARTYNLTVDDLHTYYVLAGQTPVLVHNSTCPTLTSAIHDDPLLVRAAQKAGKNQTVQRDLDAMQARLAEGNLNPGIGNGFLTGTDVAYARSRNGARLFFRNTESGIQVVGKADKGNEPAVIARLQGIYGR
ncbi:polymorphic toxin-type HINT domain-containing protein [Streptomyces sp. NPDC059568]|uniref:polymorphic toxin-type HINT domain-containing protein n=1 Tax=Streptomyces sp. NPDC059568 TaxID=3346868 RepID=UPI003696E4E6